MVCINGGLNWYSFVLEGISPMSLVFEVRFYSSLNKARRAYLHEYKRVLIVSAIYTLDLLWRIVRWVLWFSNLLPTAVLNAC